MKRRGNRRYYQRQDVVLIRQIKSLLYDQGFTIGGARQRMSGGEEPAKAMVDNRMFTDLIKDLEEVIAQL